MKTLSSELVIDQSKMSLIQGDITKQGTDALVNAANPSLMGGGGVDGAIHRVGGKAILEACKEIVKRQGRLPTGKAVITTNLASISFPSISTGAYGYPVEEASEVAIKAVSSFLKQESTSLKAVVCVLFDSATYEQYRSALEKISEAK
jgi:O-acetyl-ADP-ribose deacetylase (regulator of RNase III)